MIWAPPPQTPVLPHNSGMIGVHALDEQRTIDGVQHRSKARVQPTETVRAASTGPVRAWTRSRTAWLTSFQEVCCTVIPESVAEGRNEPDFMMAGVGRS
jgi:hypothetical protein